MASGSLGDGGGCWTAAVAPEQAWHLIRRKTGGVAGFQFAELFAAGVAAQRAPFLGRITGQGLGHGLVMGRMGDRATGAGLHAVGGLMGQGVPYRRRIPVHAADHDRAAVAVVQTLQTRLVAVLLHHPGTVGHQQGAQGVDVGPGG